MIAVQNPTKTFMLIPWENETRVDLAFQKICAVFTVLGKNEEKHLTTILLKY